MVQGAAVWFKGRFCGLRGNLVVCELRDVLVVLRGGFVG